MYRNGAAAGRPSCTWRPGPTPILTFLLSCSSKGADLNLQDEFGWTPLHRAAGSNKNPEIIKALVERGADPKAQDKHGFTPLHMAAGGNENPKVIAALLEAGADLNAPEPARGQTPLHLAADSNFNPAIVALLLEAGADPRVQDNEGRTPLDLAEGNSGLKGTAAYRRLKEAR